MVCFHPLQILIKKRCAEWKAQGIFLRMVIIPSGRRRQQSGQKISPKNIFPEKPTSSRRADVPKKTNLTKRRIPEQTAKIVNKPRGIKRPKLVEEPKTEEKTRAKIEKEEIKPKMVPELPKPIIQNVVNGYFEGASAKKEPKAEAKPESSKALKSNEKESPKSSGMKFNGGYNLRFEILRY